MRVFWMWFSSPRGCIRGASAVAECQGMFKMQHDLDKDLKFTHVFPRTCPLPPAPDAELHEGRGGGGDAAAAEGDADAVLDPIALCTGCTLKEFELLSNGNCPLYVSSYLYNRNSLIFPLVTPKRGSCSSA